MPTDSKMPPRYYIEIRGDNFYPSRVPFEFTEAWDPNTQLRSLGPRKGDVLPWGEAVYAVPSTAPVENRLKQLADIIYPLIPMLRLHGAESWVVWIVRYYNSQCNEEWSAADIAALARLECSVCYSAYEVSSSEEDEWWTSNGYRR